MANIKKTVKTKKILKRKSLSKKVSAKKISSKKTKFLHEMKTIKETGHASDNLFDSRAGETDTLFVSSPADLQQDLPAVMPALAETNDQDILNNLVIADKNISQETDTSKSKDEPKLVQSSPENMVRQKKSFSWRRFFFLRH